MIQKIDVSNVRIDRSGPREFMHWLVIHAIAHHSPKDPELKAVWDRLRSDNIEIEFKINGVDAPFEKVVYAINAQLDRMIETEAAALLKKRIGDTLETFNEKSEAVYEAMDELKSKLNERAREVFPLAARREP